MNQVASKSVRRALERRIFALVMKFPKRLESEDARSEAACRELAAEIARSVEETLATPAENRAASGLAESRPGPKRWFGSKRRRSSVGKAIL